MIDPILIAISFFALGCIAGRSDLRAKKEQEAKQVPVAGLRLVWSAKGTTRKW